jgi:predicted peptidase
MRWMGRFLWLLVSAAFLVSCGGGSGSDSDTSLDLPPDSGGVQTAVYHETTASPYGYYVYVPGGYQQDGPAYPLLVFLHGAGETGNSATDHAVLDKVLVHGPPKLIKAGQWNPAMPMIVASPQCHDGWWDTAKIHAFIDYLRSTYTIDDSRIYMTGLSMGGYGTFAYCSGMGSAAYVAAAVPICGGGTPSQAANMAHIPVWAFHGDADGTVNMSNSVNMINAINTANPTVPAKLTIYPGVGHDSWTRTYDGSGMGTERDDYDPFDQDIFDWMLQYRKTP